MNIKSVSVVMPALLALSLLAACETLQANSPTTTEQQRPNILLVMVDDMGWTDMAALAAKSIRQTSMRSPGVASSLPTFMSP